jgi:hypothetical protein
VRQESISSYIWFGMGLRYLQDAGEGQPIHGDTRVVFNIENFVNRLDGLGLTVTANAATNEGLPKLLEELKATEPESVLTGAQAKKLAGIVGAVKKTLMAESAEKKAFVTSPKRWDVERLLTDPGSMFGQGVYDQLDAHAAFDFEEACKCIAFERPTAAVFHAMRGTEAVLRTFYCHVVKQKRLPKVRRMWGPMLDQLKARSKPPPKALLDNLDGIRFNFRNPTQHPDEIHTIDRAQDLLGLTIPAVNDMIALMPE